MKTRSLVLSLWLPVLLLSIATVFMSCSPEAGGGGESTVPSPPQGVLATASSATAIDVSWTAVADATSYNVFWATNQGITKSSSTEVPGITAPSYHFAGATGVDYYFAVSAVNANGESLLSSEVNASPAPFIIAYAVGKGPNAGPEQEGVSVYTDSTKTQGIDGLTITFNGVAIAGQGGGSGVYTGFQPITPGGTITFDMLCGAKHYTVSATQYETYPTITAPASATIWDHNASNTATWTAGAPASESCYFVVVLDSSHSSFYGQPIEIPISTLTASVPAASLAGLTGPFGLYVAIATMGSINVLAGGGTQTDGIPIPSALPHSSLYLMGMGGVEPITIQ